MRVTSLTGEDYAPDEGHAQASIRSLIRPCSQSPPVTSTPDQEDFKSSIVKPMPRMLGDGGQRSVKEEMRDILVQTTAKTWKRDGGRLLRLLARV
jgi:hypothetical protein